MTSAGFQTIAETEFQTFVGDINLDGEISVDDAVVLQNYLLARTSLTEAQWRNADVISDGSVNAFKNGMHGFSGTPLTETKLYMLDYLAKLFG